MKTPSCSNLPAQFTYQPVSMSDSRGNFANADALNKKTNILDILLKKMKSTKTAASDKSALQSITQQESIQQPFEHRSKQSTVESSLLSNLLKKSHSPGAAQRTADFTSNGITFEQKNQENVTKDLSSQSPVDEGIKLS